LDIRLDPTAITLVLIDGTAFSYALAEALSKRGHRVVVALYAQDKTAGREVCLAPGIPEITVAAPEEEELTKLLSVLPGKVGTFLYVHPRFTCTDGSVRSTFEAEAQRIKSVFLLAKHLKKTLTSRERSERACFLSISRLDGRLGVANDGRVSPLGGGLSGLIKTLRLEWPGVYCRAVDLAPELPATAAADYVLAELYDPDLSLAEVARNLEGERSTLVAAPFAGGLPRELESRLTADSVVLVTGGARGITAKCLLPLAEQFRCKFIILGRTSAANEEPVWARGIADLKELNLRAAESIRSSGAKPTPKAVQKMTSRILAARELQANIELVRSVGGDVHYLSADASDAASVKAALENLPGGPSRVTAVIHGAGVLADKLIENKSAEDFDAVFNVKLFGLLSLLDNVDINSLTHLVLFSSVAGFFGNIGQSDYAIANESLNRYAYFLRNSYPTAHIVSINWGAWDSGMVGPELKKLLEANSVALIPSDQGPLAMMDQLSVSMEEQTQVILGAALNMAPVDHRHGLMSRTIRRTLKREMNPFLDDHVIQGHAVLPITLAYAWMGQTAASMYPGYFLKTMENSGMLKGVVFDGAQADTYCMSVTEVERESEHIKLQILITSDTGRRFPTQHYRSEVTLSTRPQVQPYVTIPAKAYTGLEMSKVYSDGTLFHGPDFRGVKDIVSIDSSGLVMRCGHDGVEARRQGQFAAKYINPFLADIMCQGLLIWVRKFYGCACLPVRVEKVDVYNPQPFGRDFFVAMSIVRADDFCMEADLLAFDAEDGAVYLKFHSAAVTISKDLKWN